MYGIKSPVYSIRLIQKACQNVDNKQTFFIPINIEY